MGKVKKEGKKPPNAGAIRLRKKRILRLLLILSAVFILISSIAGFATYRVVAAYMADVPEFDLEKFSPALTSFLYDKDGNEITATMGAENRIEVPLDQISENLINAFIAIEDERFFEHPGFDVRGIMRAATNNILKRSSPLQGGSTITQQLVKNTFFGHNQRTMKRKVQELYLSYQLERIFTKDEILAFYLNRIFFDFNAYGVEAAAQTYFGKSAADVTLAEAAILAGIPNMPARYSPRRPNNESKIRQTLILNRMVGLGMITAEEAREASAAETPLVERGEREREYPYPSFIGYVMRSAFPELLPTLSDYQGLTSTEAQELLYRGGFHIYTTLDRELQQVAQETINNISLYPEKDKREEGKPIQPQAAVVLAQPKTGYVAAIVGGREAQNITDFNRATEGKHQAGSVLKPIVAYAPAFHEGIASPGTVLDDAPTIYDSGKYFPNNYDRTFNGLVTARFALARSLNIPAIRLLDQLGVDKGKDYGYRMGITSLADEKIAGLSIVVGGLTDGVSVYETAQAFSVLANEGVRTNFTTITKIVDRHGRVIYQHQPVSEEIISSAAAWLTSSALQDAVRSGTAGGLKIGRPVAAKTGTSDNARDAWMAAYTPDYVAVVWVGRDQWETGTSGNFRAFQITHRFLNPIMKAAHAGLPVHEFKRPDTVRGSVAFCSKSGLRPGPFCGEHVISDFFWPKAIPSKTCDLHVEVEICQVSGLLVGEFCPDEHRVKKVFFNRPKFIITDDRWLGPIGRIPKDTELGAPNDICDQHTTAPPGEVKDAKGEVKTDGRVILSWKASSESTSYIISRKGDGGDTFKQITAKDFTATTYTDVGLSPGNYSYQIVAVNAQGVKSTPAVISVTVEPPPPSPDPEESPTAPEPTNGNSGSNGNNGRNKP